MIHGVAQIMNLFSTPLMTCLEFPCSLPYFKWGASNSLFDLSRMAAPFWYSHHLFFLCWPRGKSYISHSTVSINLALLRSCMIWSISSSSVPVSIKFYVYRGAYIVFPLYNMHPSTVECVNPVSFIIFPARFWGHTLPDYLCMYTFLCSLSMCYIISPLVSFSNPFGVFISSSFYTGECGNART